MTLSDCHLMVKFASAIGRLRPPAILNKTAQFRQGAPKSRFLLGTLAALAVGVAPIAIASPPTAPGNLAASSVSSTQINLSWTASTDTTSITAYIIERCQGSACSNFAQVGSVATGTTYTDSSLSPATVYQYEVYATDSNSTSSPFSNVASATTLVASVQGSVTYGYDALGRLVQATVPALNLVENYTYDSSGNLLSMTSSPLSVVSVTDTSSPQGSIGSTITIYGSGFSTTPSSNTVKFNGVAATVASATATQLVVTVPTGATSGSITVQTGSTLVTSPGSFTVTAAVGAPTIASFLPLVAATGSTVTVTGTGFQSVLADNQVQVNQTAATVVAASPTSITFVVPSFDSDTKNSSTFSAMSAPITVTTPMGSATSPTDLVVSTSPIGAPTITTVGAAPVTFATPTSGTPQLLAFNATAGQPIELVASNQTTPGTIVGSVVAPNGTTAANLNFTASGQSLRVLTPVTGRYTVYFYPYGAQGGSVSFSVVGALSGTLTLNGSPTTETLSVPGQSAQLTFTGTQGQNVALSFTNVSLSAAATLVLNSPDGVALLSQSLSTAGLILTPTLPAAGTYTVLITPTPTTTGGFTAALTSTASTTLTPNQGTQSLTLNGTTPTTLTFDGTVGQILSLVASETAGASSSLTLTVLQPDGTTLAAHQVSLCTTCGSTLYYNLGPLTQAGTYSLVAQQTSTATNTFAFTLATPVTGSLTIGTASNVTLTQLGQGASQAFVGNAGEYISATLVASGMTVYPTGTIAILAPDGTTIASGITSNCSVGCNEQGVVSAGPLPATGTFTVLFEQASGGLPGTGTLTFTVLAPVTGTVTVGASNAVVVANGQGFEENFAGIVGQTLSVSLQTSGTGSPTNGTVTVLDPNGVLLTSTTFSGHDGYPTTPGNAVLNLGPLASSGTYTLVFQQATSSAGLGAGTITVVPDLAASGTLTVGSSSSVSLAAGQGFAETVSGTAGEYLSVAVAAEGATAPTAGTLELLSSTGTVLATASYTTSYAGVTCSGNNCNGAGVVNLGPLPATGQYTVVFQQSNSFNSPPGSGLVTVTPEAAIQGTLTLGTPANLTLAAGQGAQESFTGAAGQYATVSVSETASLLQGAKVSVIGPSGSTVATGTFTATCSTTCTGSSSLNIGPLPSAGTYTVLLLQTAEAYGFGTGSLALTVSNNAPDSASSQNLSTSTAGASAQFTFTAAALQSFELAFSNMVLTPSSVTTYTVKVLNPAGVNVNNGSCTSGTTCLVAITGASTGTYTVTVTPGGAATMSVTASVGPLVTGTLSIGTPFNLNLPSPGQNALLSFTPTAGQDLVLHVSGMTATPSGTAYTVDVYDPTNTLVAASAPTSSATLNVPILLTGTYTVSVTTTTGSTASMLLTLSSGASGSVPSTGAGVNISTTLPDQNAYYTFSGTFGQSVTLALGNVVETPSGTSPYLVVNGPSGGSWTDSCTSSCILHIPTLPVTGTYAATLWPQAQATLSATAYLTGDVTGTLTVGTPLNLTLSETGQSASLTFAVTGEAPQTLALYISNLSATPAGTAYSVNVATFNQKDASLTSGQVTSGTTFNLPNLAPGTYVVTLIPTAPATSTLQVTLEPQNGGPLSTTSSGSGSTFTTPAPGQNSYFTFTATAGQDLSLALTGISFTPSSVTYATVSITGPGYSSTTYCYSASPSSCEIPLRNLPQTGIYSVTVTPGGVATMTFTETLSADVTSTLTAGTTQTVPLTAMGQNSWLTFNVTAGQMFGLYVGGITSTPANTSYTVTVYNSAGTSVATASTTSGTAFSLTNLAAGTYNVLITPATPATATMQATLSADVTGTLTPGTPQSLPLAAMGQDAWLTFSATAGQTFALYAGAITSVPANTSYTMTVYNSSGTSVASGSSSSTITLNLIALAAGTYNVLITPATPATATMQVTLEPQTGGTLALSGSTNAFSTPAPGQYAYFTFSGTAGQDLGIALTGLTLTPSSQQTYALVYVYEPNGTQLGYAYCYTSNPGAGCQLSLTNLPVTGSYTIKVEPGTLQTMSFNLTASQDVSGTLALNTAQNVTLVPGQNTWLSFTATAGQTVAVSATSIVTNPSGQSVTLTVYNSSGTSVGSVSGTTSATVNLANLAAGTYSVFIVPAYGASATMQVTLAAGIDPTLTLNGTTTNYATTVPGQYADFTFSGTAGQDLGVAITGLTLTPSSQQTYALVYVYEPNGTQLTYAFCYTTNPGAGCQLSLTNLPATGSYTIKVEPGTLQTMSFNLTASQPVSGTLVLNTAQTVTLASTGQIAWFTFSITSAQTVTVTTSGITTTPASTSYTVTVYNSGGSSVGSTSTTTGNTLTLTSLAAGTYNILVSPQYPATGSLQLSYQ
jgi:large repetitive protein